MSTPSQKKSPSRRVSTVLKVNCSSQTSPPRQSQELTPPLQQEQSEKVNYRQPIIEALEEVLMQESQMEHSSFSEQKSKGLTSANVTHTRLEPKSEH